MKTIKLTKNDLKCAINLLKKAEAINGNTAFPQHIFISKNDMKTLRNNVKKAFKKEHPSLKGKTLENAVGMHMLNLSPNSSLELAIKDGIMVVDAEALEEDLRRLKACDMVIDVLESRPIEF